ncbi:MAG: (4Fe-4S)-binding protein, partial [Caldiserica bacterium]
VKDLNKKFGVIVNKEMEGFDELYEYLKKENIKVLLKIPFERRIAESYSRGKTLSEIDKEWEGTFLNLYNQILEEIND